MSLSPTRTIFDAAGFITDETVANHGLEALQKIRKVSSTDGTATGRQFDCIIMDLEMPVMDGLTAVKHIRAEEAEGTLSRNQVIALSAFVSPAPARSCLELMRVAGNARQGQIDEAKAAGMDDVVIKPYRLVRPSLETYHSGPIVHC